MPPTARFAARAQAVVDFRWIDDSVEGEKYAFGTSISCGIFYQHSVWDKMAHRHSNADGVTIPAWIDAVTRHGRTGFTGAGARHSAETV